MEFRILAGLLAALLILIGVPIFIMLAIGGPWHYWLAAVNSLFVGIGFFGAARTGQWFRFSRRHEKDAA
jgi:hypothetical protein